MLTYNATTIPNGVYYWRVRAKNINSVAGAFSGSRSFTIDTTGPVAPVLSTPANAASIIGTPAFTWLASTSAVKYQFEYDNDSDFSSPTFTSAELTTLNHTPPAMAINTLFSWHVRAKDAAGNWGAWSTARTITILPPAPAVPALVAPAHGSISANPVPTLNWNSVVNAATYQVQLDNNSTFTSTEMDSSISGTNIVAPSLADGVYYWRVRAINTGGISAWSVVRRVTIAQPIPLAPVLLSPADSFTDVTGTPEFDWQSVVGGDTYQIQVDDNSDFSSPEFDDSAGTASRTPLSALADGTYYWRVRAINIYSTPGDWSDTWSITVDVP